MRPLFLLTLAACAVEEQIPDAPADPIVLRNDGGDLEGHTPRGFRGSGTGLFAGDNLNPSFPEGDGVQIFLSFPLRRLDGDSIQSATLSTTAASVSGDPFASLGDLIAEEIVYDAFSPDLWDAPVVEGGASCLFATSADGPFTCELTALVQAALDAGRTHAQIRLRHERAGDGDGSQDLTLFFLTDSNTNERGIFELEVQP